MEIKQADESIRYTEETSEESPQPEDSVQEEPERCEPELGRWRIMVKSSRAQMARGEAVSSMG